MAIKNLLLLLVALIILSCSGGKNQEQLEAELKSLDLLRGDVALCSSGNSEFGTVTFGLACSEKVRDNFNLATALLHSFEYTEAEKVFTKVIDEDPQCVMAYWGAAMCNFHPLWAPPGPDELAKGLKIVTLARSIADKSTRESDYLEAIAAIYDQWDQLDHRTRLLKFEDASKIVFEKYPDDNEAAIFYSLALRAAADPVDKTFAKQKKAGDILNAIFAMQPNHPGIAHYIIHTYDYPELAELALPASRKYASIAAASAHAQHMPSHIFTRLGLWDESIVSNINSISAAKCYAEKSGIKGHWDEELHGMDYLIYAHLQKANDAAALEQVEYLKTIDTVFPANFKDAYTFAAMPTRYALERKDWAAAAKLEFYKANFEWEEYGWERANVHFGRALGLAHSKKLDAARKELEQLQQIHDRLKELKRERYANFLMIQVKATEGWIKLYEGKKTEAVKLMTEAADMEDATEKDPVTPGEVIPARELLGDMYIEILEPAKALEAYEADLRRHPGRFNGLFGAALAGQESGDRNKASMYYKQLLSVAGAESQRPELLIAKSFVDKNP